MNNKKKLKIGSVLLQQEGNSFKLTLDKNVKPPHSVYKYHSLNSYSIQSLRDNTIHLSHPYKMNDLMDSSHLLWDFNTFTKVLNKNPEVKKSNREYCAIKLTKNIPEKHIHDFGVFCFSDTYSNDLLWAHYTNETGFCIEYNTGKLFETFKPLMSCLIPINYGKLKQIDIKKYALTVKDGYSMIIPALYSLINKERFWEYEKEWRYIEYNTEFEEVSHALDFEKKQKKPLNRNLKIDKDCINKIILAPLFFNNTRFESYNKDEFKYTYSNKSKEEVYTFLKILKSQYEDKVYQVDKYLEKGKIKRNIKYKVNIIEVNEEYCIIKIDSLSIKWNLNREKHSKK